MGLFGKELEAAIHSSGEDIEMLIEGLIASQSITQFFAGDGLGKSTLLLQAELEASAGKPVYGEFEVKRPLRVVHIQTERSPRQDYQRILLMSQRIPINLGNFFHEQELQGFDIANAQDRLAIISHLKKVKETFGPIDWLHIDPIYAWTGADLTTDVGAGNLNDMLRKIQKEICPTISYNHHPNRGFRDPESGKRKGQDMYGNRFISANCSGVFKIESRPDGNGTIWTREKDSFSCLTQKIELSYDSQFYLSYIDSAKQFTSKAERMLAFLRVCKAQNRPFTFEDFKSQNEVSTAYARNTLSRYVDEKKVTFSNLPRGKHLYSSNI